MASLDPFWAAVDKALDRIESEKPDTFEKLAAILEEQAALVQPNRPGQSFFAGSGGDRQLDESLSEAGWRMGYIDAPYHYYARHGLTLDRIEYIEGDVIHVDSAGRRV